MLYDDLGSRLFEEITSLPEYYPTRTERALLEGQYNCCFRCARLPTVTCRRARCRLGFKNLSTAGRCCAYVDRRRLYASGRIDGGPGPRMREYTECISRSTPRATGRKLRRLSTAAPGIRRLYARTLSWHQHWELHPRRIANDSPQCGFN
jgi:Histidine-specific methyltransferase, SAM-dependent